ncbi:MAG: hypothetical protein RIC55_33090 [Pirellulaceae bacterium]
MFALAPAMRRHPSIFSEGEPVSGKSLILRFDDVLHQDSYSIQRLYGLINATNFVKLVAALDLRADPRESKTGPVTDDIRESLERTPDLFQFKSKGILVAAGACRHLERQRCELKFNDLEIEGVLDGGHNTLALALFLLDQVVEHPREVKLIKIWSDLSPVWERYSDEVQEVAREQEFLIPVEVLYPTDGCEEEFISNILEIAQARNNNAQLTAETKAHKAGYYDVLKECLDPRVADLVEWKTNDGGKIKSKDLVALALIPLSLVSREETGIEINPTLIYSSKGNCVRLFSEIFEHENVSVADGPVRRLVNERVRNALSLLRDLPRLYDLIYRKFPTAYNHASPGFGRIQCVKHKEGKPVFRTKYYGEKTGYRYPDGFIMPLLYGLRELISVSGDNVTWHVDPFQFLDKWLDEIVEPYREFVIVMAASYDPQKVGKTHASYKFAAKEFATAVQKGGAKQLF